MSSKKRGKDEDEMIQHLEELDFEDPIEDEFEEEIEWADDEARAQVDIDKVGGPARVGTRVWLKQKHGLEEGVELTYDSSAYDMLHALRVEWPCLSVAVLTDALGQQRRKFPHTMYIAAGTQASEASANKVLLMKLSDLCKTKYDSDDEDALDEDNDDEEDDAKMITKAIMHPSGGVNRIKAMPQEAGVLATWSESSDVFVWDARAHLLALDDANLQAPARAKPMQTLTAHTTEGFALDWSPTVAGRLATGDCSSVIRVWEAEPNESDPYVGHTDSVEDVQWSPVEHAVFASCSVDKSIKVWDTRQRGMPALSIDGAHDCDVNVISWNKHVTYLCVSGADDGTFRVWDFRALPKPAAQFAWHTQPISSIEWSPQANDESALTVACAEQVSIWDLSLERDVDAQANPALELPANLDEVDSELPPQLLFTHRGQLDIKDVHWHPQIPGALISTAADGINVWKPSNC